VENPTLLNKGRGEVDFVSHGKLCGLSQKER